MTRQEFKKFTDTIFGQIKSGPHFAKTPYKSKAEYDSLLASGAVKDNWWEKLLFISKIEVNEKYDHNSSRILRPLRKV